MVTDPVEIVTPVAEWTEADPAPAWLDAAFMTTRTASCMPCVAVFELVAVTVIGPGALDRYRYQMPDDSY